MFQDPSISVRATQRAPRSCIACSSRKVKCDKSMPCGTCIRRGQSENCSRELVLVRGEVTTYQDAPQVPTYEELRRENEQLRREIDISKAEIARPQSPSLSLGESHESTVNVFRPRKQWCDQDEGGLEQKLWDNLAAASPDDKTPIMSWNDIVLPSQTCSAQLIAYDEKWNSWVHYAVEYPHFRNECNDFIATKKSGISLEAMDFSWMAVYFSILSAALLMMDDVLAEKLTLHEPFEHQMLSRIWYDAAIFCLHRANFMRVPSIRSVQAVAVLGICFNNFGDSDLGEHMWSCAIRIAQRIGLHTPYSTVAGKYLGEEAQHRLWWTLVICEWLSLPYHPPAVDEIDFDVPYPTAPQSSPLESTESDQEHPVHYHIFMARTALAFHRFRKAIRSEWHTLDETIRIVRAADEELAHVIDTLPAHLQPDQAGEDEEERMQYIEQTKPWVVWQRYDLTLVLLHLRIRVNRTLQDQWLSTSVQRQLDWARTISIGSAVSVIWINSNWNQPASMRKQWALSYHIFTSAVLLLRECQESRDRYNGEHRETIQAAVQLLDRVKARNSLARHALIILLEKIDSLRLV